MKGIFSVATFLALASALVTAAPLTKRATVLIPANALYIVNNPNPAPVPMPPSTPNAKISIVDGSNEIDTIVSFDVSSFTATSTSTCQFVIQNIPPPSGSGIVQLFTLGAEVTSSTAFVPYENQYEGQYDVNTDPSTPIDVKFVPCNFQNGVLQFIIRPQDTDDAISWVQTSTDGAFIAFTQ